MKQFGEAGLGGPIPDEFLQVQQENEELSKAGLAVPTELADIVLNDVEKSADLQDAMAKIEAEGGLEAHKNRYSGRECPMAKVIGMKALEGITDRIINAKKAVPGDKPTMADIIAAKLQKKTEEAKKQTDQTIKVEIVDTAY